MDKINHLDFFKMNNIDRLPSSNFNDGSFVDATNSTKGFKEVMGDLISQINEVTNKPDKVAQDAMLNKADIHDVMAAISQSELTVQAATTITGKILQTYEKIMQIQI